MVYRTSIPSIFAGLLTRQYWSKVAHRSCSRRRPLPSHHGPPAIAGDCSCDCTAAWSICALQFSCRVRRCSAAAPRRHARLLPRLLVPSATHGRRCSSCQLTTTFAVSFSPACQWFVGDPLLELVRTEEYRNIVNLTYDGVVLTGARVVLLTGDCFPVDAD
jgi:hypothetical protein